MCDELVYQILFFWKKTYLRAVYLFIHKDVRKFRKIKILEEKMKKNLRESINKYEKRESWFYSKNCTDWISLQGLNAPIGEP